MYGSEPNYPIRFDDGDYAMSQLDGNLCMSCLYTNICEQLADGDPITFECDGYTWADDNDRGKQK